jgi:murein DD-endopeptidase MepM/ murein hydrolase activator NlpD
VNHQPIFNRDIKSHRQPGKRPALLRVTYLAAFGVILVATAVLWGSNPESVEAKIQSLPVTASGGSAYQVSLALPGITTHAEDDIQASLEPASAPESPAHEISADVIPAHEPPAPEKPAYKKPASSTPEGDWHDITVKSGDSLAAIFSRLGIKPQQLHNLLALGGAVHNLEKIYPGQTIRLQTNSERGLLALSYPIDKLSSLEVVRDGDDFAVSTIHRTPEHRVRNASVVINNSLFLAAQEAGLSDHLTMELAGIFAWDIDFALDIRKGDEFTVLYEELYLDGENIGGESILAAEFINRGTKYHAIRYADDSGNTDFYALDGKSMRKTFLRTPVEFSRISSRFSLGRKHPVLNKIRAHKGVDYAASRGTPVKATGNGKIIHLGKKGGYGNTIIIQHGTSYSTLYAHLSKYRGGLKTGSRVKQGQTVGYVGSSGLATGPHLHYEFRVDGAHRDPLRVKLPGAQPLDKKYHDDFNLKAEALVAQLDLVRNVQVASR